MDGSGLIACTKSAKIGRTRIMTLIIWFLSPLRKSTDTGPTVGTTLKKKRCQTFHQSWHWLPNKISLVPSFLLCILHSSGKNLPAGIAKRRVAKSARAKLNKSEKWVQVQEVCWRKEEIFFNMEKNHWLFWKLHMLVVVLMYSFFIITCHTSLIHDSLSKHLKWRY